MIPTIELRIKERVGRKRGEGGKRREKGRKRELKWV